MSLSKKAVKGAVVKSRELTIEELAQVGGAWSISDSGGYSEPDYFYDYGYTDYSWENPQVEYFDYGIPTVYVEASSWTGDQQIAWNQDFSQQFDACWNGTTALDGVAMAIGGTFADAVFTGAAWVGVGEFFSDFGDVTQAISDFNARAGEVGYRFAYCEYKAQEYAYDQQ